MEEIKWVRFLVVFERSHADLVDSYLQANGLQTQVIQEAYFQYQIGAGALGEIEILVPSTQLEIAKALYAETGWNFDVTDIEEVDDEEENADE